MDMMSANLELLIQAAEFVERNEKEFEYGDAERDHGYAQAREESPQSTSPVPTSNNSSNYNNNKSSKHHSRRIKSKSKLHNTRTTHNELEKNRRAHLRTCLEKLKELVPLGSDGTRHTTLGLLTKATHFIKCLEDKDVKHKNHKGVLEKQHEKLQKRLENLEETFVNFKRRSVSESSTFSSSSSSSGYSEESDEVDILGYGNSHGSDDSDDQFCSRSSSCSGEGGVILSTRRLTIDESYSKQPL